ncbi:retrovirus-related pol polyprotein from transposon TNT 1-94 [Tanacetum coccineum]|uniref:Retrovirus-related pol polyprotein from transposon TNT 1-94 n=1 Tax=Tanacetum coccineum TaxID=301880 RepID=A0ABQ5G4X2_9ASTR
MSGEAHFFHVAAFDISALQVRGSELQGLVRGLGFSTRIRILANQRPPRVHGDRLIKSLNIPNCRSLFEENRNGNVVAAWAKSNGNRYNGNQIRCYNCKGVGHYARNCTVKPKRKDVAYLQTQLMTAQKEEAGIQLQVKEFDLMAYAGDCEEIKKVNANYILMANLQQTSTTVDSSMDPGGGELEQHTTIVKETRAYFESLYNNLVIEIEKVNTVNRKMREKNADLTTKLARYKGQKNVLNSIKIKIDKLENKHDPPAMYDSEETLQLAQESRLKMKQLNKEIEPLFLKEVTKFVRDFKSPTNEADESLDMNKVLEYENERLLKAVVNQDIMINTLQNSRVEKVVPNKPVKPSVKTKPITVSQPHVMTKKDVNSDSNGLSSAGVESTAKT